MKLSTMYERGRVLLSFEVFPPKRSSPVDTIYAALAELSALEPGFISVTYGAGGNLADTSTADIAAHVKKAHGIEAVAHLTCINSTRSNIDTLLDKLTSLGIENILALRGDINPNVPPEKDFRYASELIAYIKARGDFGISAACYPEGHVDAKSLNDDIRSLKLKVEAGADSLVTQLFFDNDIYYRFSEKLQLVGVNVPISAGIMPVTSKSQIERMVTMCGASLPPKFTKMMSRYENNPEALTDAGIAYAVDQIVGLIASGIDGIHIYTMNKPYIARRITEAVKSLL